MPKAAPTPEPAQLEFAPEPAPPAVQPEPAPKQPAKPADEVEDLFKESSTPTTEPEATDMPEEPAKPAEKSDEVEDLFKEADDKQTRAPAKTGTKVSDSAMQQELEDLFTPEAPQTTTGQPAPAENKQGAVNQVAAQSVIAAPVELPNAMRVWTDNTGNYKVNARLVSVSENSVRLLKDSGKFTTVPFDRLSGADLDFVRRNGMTSIARKF